MVFYRKYRPQTIDELDSPKIRETLYAVLAGFVDQKTKEPAHGYLFTGPKGLGKTSTARIVAKVIDCEVPSEKRRKGLEPCNKCEQCISITAGTNMDVLEIDGASNRGIDEIRDLREKIKLAPAYAKKKVYIIDEVHMLTTEAFNALLKTLEEPPSHAVFILCTTEPHKVPDTISSRAFKINFTLATKEELERAFKRISASEKIEIDDEALGEIATLSDGSFRDGTKILDELVSLASGKRITKELIDEKFSTKTLNQKLSEILEILSDKDISKGLVLTEQMVKEGIDFRNFMERLIQEVHSLLLTKAGVSYERQEAADKFSLQEIKKLAELSQKASIDTKYSPVPQLPLELLLVEWCSSALIEQPSPGELPVKEEKSIKTPVSAERTVHEVKKDEDEWIRLISAVKGHNHTVAGVLRGGRLKTWDDKNVIIEAQFPFHKEKLEESKTKLLLEQVCEEIKGKKVTVKIILAEK